MLLTAAAAMLTLAGVLSALPMPQPTDPAPTPQPQPDDAPPDDAAGDEPVMPDGETEAEIVLKDGKRVSGVLVEQNADRVILSIGGIPTTFKMSVIDRVRALPSVEERYELLRAAIAEEDSDGILRLAEWLRARKRYGLALLEIERVLTLEPGHPDANALKTLIIEQVKLENLQPAPRNAGDRPAPRPRAPALPAFPVLTEEQINLIRVFEVDLKDPPRMLIERETVDRFLDKYAGTMVEGRGSVPVTPEGRDAFHRDRTNRPHLILAWMFDLKAREFYREVKVLENPKSLRLFRDNVHRTWLINSCATNRCHGGEEAGRLWLYNRRQSSDIAAYTNFLIMERYKLDNGLTLINYAEPSRSPLLQMGLPRDEAIFKHPEVGGVSRARWKPVFRSQEDERFQDAVNWILLMYPKRPEYPIDYTPPQPKAAGAPLVDDGAAPPPR